MENESEGDDVDRRLGLRIILFLLLMMIVVVGCQSAENSDDLDGTLIVWHTWPEPEQALIEDLFDRFSEVHPEVTIVSEYVDDEILAEEFLDSVRAGLGPDLLVGINVRDLRFFIDRNLLANLDELVTTQQLSLKAVDGLTTGSGQYGIPLASSTPVLFFNKSLAKTPPKTLAEFDLVAEEEQTIAIPTDFRSLYWGVTTFGGELLTRDGELIVDDTFTDWLDWLVSIAGKPYIVLENDYDDLRNLFANGEVGYFIGNSLDLPYFREQLGEENIGVSPLPENESTTASAFLDLESLTISRISNEADLAIELIEFLTNAPHQREIALGGSGRVPVNTSVRIDSRFSPDAYTLYRQSLKGVILPLEHGIIGRELLAAGDELYGQVLEGVVLPEEAGDILIEAVDGALSGESQ